MIQSIAFNIKFSSCGNFLSNTCLLCHLVLFRSPITALVPYLSLHVDDHLAVNNCSKDCMTHVFANAGLLKQMQGVPGSAGLGCANAQPWCNKVSAMQYEWKQMMNKYEQPNSGS